MSRRAGLCLVTMAVAALGTVAICHLVATRRADASGGDAATATVARPGAAARNVIGLNIGTALYYDNGKIYADATRSAVIPGSAGNVDSNGWPLSATFSVANAGWRAYNQGRWVIYWEGTAKVASVAGTWDRRIHGPGGKGPDGLPLGANTRYITVDASGGDFGISFFDAARNDGTGRAGLTNIKMMRPTSPGGNSAHRRDETVSRAVRAEAAKGVGVFRYMDFLGTNWSQIRTWGGYPWQPSKAYSVGQRVTMCRGADQGDPCGRVFECTAAGTSGPSASGGPEAGTIGAVVTDGTVSWRYLGYGRALPTWSGFSRSERDGFGFAGVGGPYEDVIRFSNEMNVDAFINVPHLADDDFLVKLALLFRWGSDGAMPHTGPHGSGGANPQPRGGPLYPPLKPDLNLYLEYSNELWNTQFSQTPWIRSAATADGELDFDGNTANLWNRYMARQMVKISNAFRAAFGDADMPSTGRARIRPTIQGQLGVPAQTHGAALKFIHDYFGDGDGKDHGASRAAHGFDPRPHPITYYLWGAGVAPYWASRGATVADQLHSMRAASGNWTAHNDTPARYIKSFGLKVMTYEGGPEVPNNPLGRQTNMTDRPSVPNMRDTVIDNYNHWTRSGGDMAVYYSHVWMGNAPLNWVWVHDDGAGGNVWNLDSPKMNAIQELAGAPPVAVTLGRGGLSTGTAIPGTAPGGKYSVWWSSGVWAPDPPGTGSRVLNGADAWQNLAGYLFLAPDGADRTVSAAVSGGGTVVAYLDGVKLGASQVAKGTVTFGSLSLGPGLHGVLLVAASGKVTVTSLTVK